MVVLVVYLARDRKVGVRVGLGKAWAELKGMREGIVRLVLM